MMQISLGSWELRLFNGILVCAGFVHGFLESGVQSGCRSIHMLCFRYHIMDTILDSALFTMNLLNHLLIDLS